MERGYMECVMCNNRTHIGKFNFKTCKTCHGTNVCIGAYEKGFALYPVETTKIETLSFYKNYKKFSLLFYRNFLNLYKEID